MLNHIRKHFQESGIEEVQMAAVLGETLRIAQALQGAGEKFELDQGIRNHFKEIGLSNDQIDRIVGIASRIAHSGDNGEQRNSEDQQHDKNPRLAKYRELVARIQAAVESGELSPEEAEQKLLAIRQELFGKKREHHSGSK